MSLDDLTKKVNKKYDAAVFTKGSKAIEMPRIPTGSFSLDVETGGGFPVGKISTITGQFSDGKTSVALKVVAEFQKRWPDREVVWMDVEGAWDAGWSKALGVDTDNIYLVRPEYSQQAFDIAEQCIINDVGLVVVDSVAALVPKEEAEATMEDWQVGLQARINGKFMRKAQSAMNSSKIEIPPSIIFINQLRENVGYGASVTEPGGKALKYHAALKIMLQKGDYYPAKPVSGSKIFDSEVEPKAQQIKFFTEKNRTAPAKRTGYFWFYFDTLDEQRPKGHIDQLEEIIRYALKYEIVTQAGSMYYIDGFSEERLSFKGSNKLAEYLRDNKDAWEYIAKQVREKVNVSF